MTKNQKGDHGMLKNKIQCIGLIIAAFGLGVLLALFLPKSVLVYLLAILIVASGVFIIM